MGKKIVFIGAGSFDFTREVVKDILTFPLLEDSVIALVDLHKGRLEMARRSCQKIIDIGNYHARVITSTDRRDVLKNADVVITTILSGSVNVWQHDILIPKKYGIDINVGDTRGPSGIFRMLRTLPEMLRICADVRELCPKAIFLNYTNPMAMLCHGMQKSYPDLTISGLCHSVQGTVHDIASWLGIKREKIDYTCAGINHMAYYTRLDYNGKNLYPRLKKKILEDEEIYNIEPVRNELFLMLGHYVTESSGHSSEYSPWFRKRPDLLKKYCNGTSWNPGKHAAILKDYKIRAKTWRKKYSDWLNNPEFKNPEYVKNFLKPGEEYAAYIANAWVGGEPFEFNGNVPNNNLITNIPSGVCVEVPVLATRNKLQSMYVGDLPQQLVPLVSLSASIETMAVDGSLTGNPELVYQAIVHDPLTSAKLSIPEIKKMVGEMFRKNRDHLPQFKNFDF